MANTASIVGIIAGRLDSSRLPGKLLKVVAGRPLIGYVIERAKRLSGLSALVLATTARAVDDPLAEYAAAAGLKVYRGEVDDVAHRLLGCAREFSGEYFVRLNGDSPFLDPALIGEAMQFCSGGYDLITNLAGRTFPYGIAVELINTKAYEAIYRSMTSDEDREHVTKFIYDHAGDFKIKTMLSPCPKLSQARLVVDNEQDLRIFALMVANLPNQALTASYQIIARQYLATAGNLDLKSGFEISGKS